LTPHVGGNTNASVDRLAVMITNAVPETLTL
jgi:phosphoglycerate dehydrogenase-like enzyme